MALWPASVERWRELVIRHGQGLPLEFLMAWIRYESGGNPASLGAITEVGIFQCDLQDGPRYGGTLETLHRAFAPAASQTATRALTDTERELQVTSGLTMIRGYVDRTDKALAAVGATWTKGSADYWSMVKWQHNLPAYTVPLLKLYRDANGRAPSGFRQWADYINALPIAPAGVSSRYWNTEGKGLSKYMNNAMRVGAYGGAELLGPGGHLYELGALVALGFALHYLAG